MKTALVTQKGMDKMSKVLILDGDSIAYKCSAAGEQRSIEVLHKPSGICKSFKHRTEFKEAMKQRGKEITEDYQVVDKQECEPLEYILSTCKRHIERIANLTNADDVVIFAGETWNFRNSLALPKPYKGNRSGTLRPVHLQDAKKFLRNKYKAMEAVGCEVDDECCISAYETLEAGDIPLLYRYEKDSDSFDGITLVTEGFSGVEYKIIPELGELTFDKNKVKGDGIKFLAYQWIESDPVDNYKAHELSKVRFGPKSAYEVLKSLNSPAEVLQAVIQQFKVFYPEKFEYTDFKGDQHEADWRYMLELYFQCCRMQRRKNDPLDVNELFDKYKVHYN